MFFRKTSDAWDIEDFVKLGKKVRACPYFGTRELKNRYSPLFTYLDTNYGNYGLKL